MNVTPPLDGTRIASVIALIVPALFGCGAARGAPVPRSIDPLTLVVRAEAYEQLPPELAVELTAADGRTSVTCSPSPGCERTLERPRGAALLVVRYRPRRGHATRVIRRSLELPSDVRSLEVELRFAELVAHDWIWLERAAVLRARALDDPGPALVRVADDPAGRPSYELRNESERRFWPADGPYYEGRWQRWDGQRWEPLEPQGGLFCGMQEQRRVQPLGPGDVAPTRESMSRFNNREHALPTGRVRYVVRLAEVLDAGRGVMRADAREGTVVPMLVDVFELSDELEVDALPLSASQLDPARAVDPSPP